MPTLATSKVLAPVRKVGFRVKVPYARRVMWVQLLS